MKNIDESKVISVSFISSLGLNFSCYLDRICSTDQPAFCFQLGVMADWAYLPHELLVLIVAFVKRFQDFAAFRTVCKSWHGAASKEHFKELWLRERTPYLMLPVSDGNTRDFYSLSEAKVVASVRFPNLSEKKCYESLGWFLAVDKDGSVCLFDPFSTTQIPVPPLITLPYFWRHRSHVFVKKMVLSARPSNPSDPSVFVVALIFRSFTGAAFWKPGHKTWHLTRFCGQMYEDITYHAGNFYVFDKEYQVTSFNILNGFPEQGQVISPYMPDAQLCQDINVYIVKMSGPLLLVTRAFSKFNVRPTQKFNVYEFDVSSNTWNKINNLGHIALFLGSDIATSIVDCSRFPGFAKANHIYFTDDGERNPFKEVGKPGRAVTGKDMGVYNLGNERIERICHGKAFKSKVSHPAWILPFLWSLPADEMHTL